MVTLYKFRKPYSKFNRRHSELMWKCNVSLKTLLQECRSEFYDDLVYKFRKSVGKTDFCSYSLKRLSLALKMIGYNMYILRQTAFMVVNPVMVDTCSCASFINSPTVGWSTD